MTTEGSEGRLYVSAGLTRTRPQPCAGVFFTGSPKTAELLTRRSAAASSAATVAYESVVR